MPEETAPTMTPVAPPPLATQPGSNGTVIDSIRHLGIVRPYDHRWGAGVAVGLARYWGVDPILVRGGFVVATLSLGVGIFAYGLAWLLLPEPNGRVHAEAARHGSFTAGFFGAAAVTVTGLLALLGGSNGVNQPLSVVVGLAMIAGVFFIVRKSRAEPQTSMPAPMEYQPQSTSTHPPAVGTPVWGTPTGTGFTGAQTGAPDYSVHGAAPIDHAMGAAAWDRSRSVPDRALTLLTLGGAILAGTVAAAVGLGAAVCFAAALGVVGMGMVVSGLRGRRSGVLLPLAIVLAVLAPAATSSSDPDIADPGEYAFTPTSAAQAGAGFTGSFGSTVVDLTDPALSAELNASAGATTIPIELISGEVVVILPDGVAAEVRSRAGAGEITDEISHSAQSGMGPDLTTKVGTGPTRLKVMVSLAAGQITVRQSPSKSTTGATR